ncbi:hypothetical protein DSO57_1030253 [Entomophthora muscae]|uniref:Uncharacterized protein n=1 Tax=Entomophthora muscae TaxID=34485 RepID=A0ACC2UAG3_9FUNG|nr:hypothetical protein DSO57_1030253 [Entomophthora muscae]
MVSAKSKQRRAGRSDWKERVDESIKALWSKSTMEQGPFIPATSFPIFNKRISTPPAISPGMPGRRQRAASEVFSAFAQAIQDTNKPFTLNLQPSTITTTSRYASLPTSVQASTSQLGLFNNDASLKHARRRIRLASDFDQMLANGFPNLGHPEPTLYISLTPKVASQASPNS